jgi:hypothetical protein
MGGSFETLQTIYKSTRRHNPEDTNFHRLESLKSHQQFILRNPFTQKSNCILATVCMNYFKTVHKHANNMVQ